jgi:hypothetical protein
MFFEQRDPENRSRRLNLMNLAAKRFGTSVQFSRRSADVGLF